MAVKVGLIDNDNSPSGKNRFNKLQQSYNSSRGRDESGIDLTAYWRTLDDFTNVLMTSGSIALANIQRIVIIESSFMNKLDVNASLGELVKMQEALNQSGVKTTRVILMASSVDIFNKIKQFPDKYMLYRHFMVGNAQRNAEGSIDIAVLDDLITGRTDDKLFTITTEFRNENTLQQKQSERLKNNIKQSSNLNNKLEEIRALMNQKKEPDPITKIEEEKKKKEKVKKTITEHVKKSNAKIVDDVISDEILKSRQRLLKVDRNFTYKGKFLKDHGFIVAFGSPTHDWNLRLLNVAQTYAKLGMQVLFVNLTGSYEWQKDLINFDYDKLPSATAMERYQMPVVNQVRIYSDTKNFDNQYQILKKFYQLEIINKFHLVFINMVLSDFAPFVESYYNPLLPTQIISYGDDSEITANIAGNRTGSLLSLSGKKMPILRVYDHPVYENIHRALKNMDEIQFRNVSSIMENIFIGDINYGG